MGSCPAQQHVRPQRAASSSSDAPGSRSLRPERPRARSAGRRVLAPVSASFAPPRQRLRRRRRRTRIEAEQSVLGAILLSERAMYALVIEEGLKPEDFYRERHRLDLRGDARALPRERADRRPHGHRAPASPTGDGEAGGRHGRRARPRGVPAAGNVRQYARIVREHALLRRLLNATYEIQASVAEQPRRAARARRAGRAGDARGRPRRPPEGLPLDRGGPRTTSSTSCTGCRSRAPRSPARRPASRTSTRSPAASSPATSSSSPRARRWGSRRSSRNIAENAAIDYNRPVALFSLEMSETELAQRFVACQARIKGDELRKGRVAEHRWPKILEAIHAARERAAVHRRLVRRRHARDPREGAPAAPAARARADHRRLPAAHAAGRHDREPRRADRPDEPRAEDPRPRAQRARHRAVAALPRRREPHRQAPDPLRPARVRPDRAGRRPRRLHLPRGVLRQGVRARGRSRTSSSPSTATARSATSS